MNPSNDPLGALPRKDVGNGLYRPLLFNRSGRKYNAETFSDMESAGADHCFRWEVVNSSKPDSGNSNPDDEAIDELNWPRAGIRVRHMMPGDQYREYNNRRDRVEAANQSNPVYAFENEEQVTQSWVTSAPQPQQPQPQQEGSSSSGQGTKYEIMPAFAAQQKMGIEPSLNPNVPITVISFAKGAEAPPQIEQEFGFGNALIQVRSRVAPGDNQLQVFTNGVVAKQPEGGAQYGFPGIIALQRTDPKALGNPKDAARFLEVFREASQTAEPKRDAWNVSLTVAATSDGSFTIYRVLQPVTIFAGESKHCYLAATYSPIPITFTLRDCWTDK